MRARNSAGSTYYGNEFATYGTIPISEAPWLVQQNGIPQDGISDFISRNLNQQIVEELRFTSTDTSSPWQWVAGIYFMSNTHPANFYNTYAGGPNSNGGPTGRARLPKRGRSAGIGGMGITGTQRWGTQMMPFGFDRVNFATEDQSSAIPIRRIWSGRLQAG